MSFIAKTLTNFNTKLVCTREFIPLVTSVRYRYHKEKIEKGPLHRLGYKDTLHTEGLLPRSEEFTRKLPMKTYRPKNIWIEKEALLGRNDYIDILGDGNLKPTDVCYKVPFWLRGFKGNEYQMLLRRRKVLGASIKEFHPSKYITMEKRIKFLYKQLNFKTKDYFWKKP